MDKQEKIVSPAVRMRFTESELCQEITQDVMCLGYKDQFIDDVKHLYDDVLWDIEEEIHGFMTSKGRFVEPIEAQKIAIACGQYRDPNARIKSLEKSIEVGWDSVKYAKNSIMISSLKKRIAEDQETLDALKAGYLGNALRVEDLHYG